MGEGAGLQLREHDRRLARHSERRGRGIGGGRECSEVLTSEWEMCSHGGAAVLAGWVLEVGDARRC